MDSKLNEFQCWHGKHSFTCVPDRNGPGKDFLDAVGKNVGLENINSPLRMNKLLVQSSMPNLSQKFDLFPAFSLLI